MSIKRWNTGRTIMHKRKMRTFEDYEIDYYKKHPKEIKQYLKLAFEEYQKDGNEQAFLVSLSIAAKAQGGFSKLARKTGLNRENLYRVLSERSDPRFSTVMQVLHSFGMSLKLS
jgi:probable addiction module antidote protein